MKNYKFLLGMFSILLAFSLTLLGCSDDPTTPTTGAEEPEQVSDGTITGLDFPVTNATPVAKTDVSGSGFTVTTLTWKGANGEHTGAFVDGTVYTAELVLTPISGKTFEGITFGTGNTGFFKLPVGQTGHTITQPATTPTGSAAVTVTIAFPAAATLVPVTSGTLTGLTAPVTGAAPVANTDVNGNGFTVTGLTWKDANGEHTGAFAAATVYTAELVLTPNSGKTFAGVTFGSGNTGFFKPSDVTGLTITQPATTPTGSATVTVTIAFPATVALVPVTSGTLTGLVAPVTGDTPILAAAVTGSGFTVTTLTWKKPDASTLSGDFVTGIIYTAELVLTPDSGKTFEGITIGSGNTGFFKPSDVTGLTITQPATTPTGKDTVTVTIAFPVTTG